MGPPMKRGEWLGWDSPKLSAPIWRSAESEASGERFANSVAILNGICQQFDES